MGALEVAREEDEVDATADLEGEWVLDATGVDVAGAEEEA